MHVHGQLTDGNVAKQPTKTRLFNLNPSSLHISADCSSVGFSGWLLWVQWRQHDTPWDYSVVLRENPIHRSICPLQPKVWSVLIPVCLDKMGHNMGTGIVNVAEREWVTPVLPYAPNVEWHYIQRNLQHNPTQEQRRLFSLSEVTSSTLADYKVLSSTSASRPGYTSVYSVASGATCGI